MTALLEALQERGATIAVHGDRLRVEAPKGALTAELQAGLSAHKALILDLLSRGYLHFWLSPVGDLAHQREELAEALDRGWETLQVLGPQVDQDTFDRAFARWNALAGWIERIDDILQVRTAVQIEKC